MPTRRRTLAVGLASILSTTGCGRPAIGRALPAPALRRGVNIHHMLNWPAHWNGQAQADYVWPPFESAPYQLAAETLDEIVTRGFTFVRLTIDPSIFIAVDAARRAELSKIVLDRVDRFLAAGLEVLVDLHPVQENPAYPPERLTSEAFAGDDAYAQVVRTLARNLRQRPVERVALELMNEPHPEDPGGARRWQAQQARLYAAARQAAPDLALVVCGTNWSGGHELTTLDLTPYRDGNVIFTFHYYNPHLFTHAGMPTALPEYYVKDLAWPPNRAQAGEVMRSTAARIAAASDLSAEEKASVTTQARRAFDSYFSEVGGEARVDRDFREVADWARAHAVPANRVLVGEFGAYRRPDETPEARAARLAWLETVRRAADQRGFGWAVWVLMDVSGQAGSIGLLPHGKVTGMDSGVVHALGLRTT